jgi:glutamate racemase
MPDDRPIGAFDSGVGGLTIVSEIRRLLPAENVVFLADSAHCPYGPRPEEQIRALSMAIVDTLLARGAKLIVVACNTASVASLAHLRRVYGVPFVGIVPAVKPAAERTRTKRVGVIATNTTLRGRIFDELVERFASDVVVMRQVCPGLVELAEEGLSDGPAAESVLRDCLSPPLAERIDTLVLGCTHYVFFRPLIQRLVGDNVDVIDTGLPVARQVARLLDVGDLHTARQGEGTLTLLTTAETERFTQVVQRLTGQPVTAEHVELTIP